MQTPQYRDLLPEVHAYELPANDLTLLYRITIYQPTPRIADLRDATLSIDNQGRNDENTTYIFRPVAAQRLRYLLFQNGGQEKRRTELANLPFDV
jgi:hypothetical protein